MKLRHLALLILAITTLYPAVQAYGQPMHTGILDSIDSPKEITDLIEKIDSNYYPVEVPLHVHFSDPDIDHLADSLQVRSWLHADLDGNGHNDLLVLGYNSGGLGIHSSICIMDDGDGQLRLRRISLWWFEDGSFPIYRLIDGQPAIVYYAYRGSSHKNGLRQLDFRIDTLVYRYGDFIELNRSPASHHIEKIEYNADYCFGSCPVYQLSIDKDLTGTYDAIDYNKVSGKFNTRVDSADYQRIINILNYIDFEKLDSSYSMNVTDLPTCTLRITYDNGKVKVIRDYGEEGTFGLSLVHSCFYEIHQTLDRIYAWDFVKSKFQRELEQQPPDSPK